MMKKIFTIIFCLFLINTAIAQIDSLKKKRVLNPKVAVLLSSCLPGSGQIYNRKYWKVPIVYGALVPLGYYVNEFNKDYFVYKGYITDLDKNPNTVIPNELTLPTLKTKMDEARHDRDLYFLIGVGVWGLNIIDAYVDAELSNFDVSEDLSMTIYPSYQNNYLDKQLFSVNFKFNFKY